MYRVSFDIKNPTTKVTQLLAAQALPFLCAQGEGYREITYATYTTIDGVELGTLMTKVLQPWLKEMRKDGAVLLRIEEEYKDTVYCIVGAELIIYRDSVEHWFKDLLSRNHLSEV